MNKAKLCEAIQLTYGERDGSAIGGYENEAREGGNHSQQGIESVETI